MRLPYDEAAAQFIEKHFPSCNVAILSGSVVSGQGTDHSDLDLVIIDDSQPGPFRACYFENDWPIEAFVFTTGTYRIFFDNNHYHAIPTLQRLCANGLILKDDGTANELVQEAKDLLSEGPWPLSTEEINQARYEIAECLEDLEGSVSRHEDLFIVNRLATLVLDFELRSHGYWTGVGKWAVRALSTYSELFCRQFMNELDSYYKNDTKDSLVAFVDGTLQPYGGRLFAGYRQEG
jgi:hypothetical protein